MISRPLLILVCGCTLAGPVVAGNLDAPAAPDAAGSAMYTLQSLCDRLSTGATGAKRSTAFVEPTTGPAATMCTLNNIMEQMPAVNANGATAADVLPGKTFWGLTGGAWGLQTGSMVTQTASNATTSQSAGYYNAFNLATVDTDLAPANIKSGISIFGVAGTYTGSNGTTSAPFPVAKTGQTTSYATGDDGDLEKGVAWPSPRFTDNANGTVTDELTGLVWLKNANCDGAKQWAAAVTWAAALASGSCGLTDGSVAGQWRLPTIKELSSLVHSGFYDPAVPFTGVQSTFYWSSTTYAPNPSRAWLVYLYDGIVYSGDKPGTSYVWPVRDG